MRDPQALAVRRKMDGIFPHCDVTERQPDELARVLVMIAWNVDHLRALARMAQYFLHDIVMRLWPVPAFAQLPAIENVANQIERVALMGAQKIEQVIRLTARCSEVDVRDPDGAIVMLIVALGHRYAILPPELRY